MQGCLRGGEEDKKFPASRGELRAPTGSSKPNVHQDRRIVGSFDFVPNSECGRGLPEKSYLVKRNGKYVKAANEKNGGKEKGGERERLHL